MTQLQPTTPLRYNASAVAKSVGNWAKAKTSANSIRYDDIVHMKRQSVEEFFASCEKHPNSVTPSDVQAWIAWLRVHRETGGTPSETTIYHMVSRLSAYYNWLITNKMTQFNPAQMVKPPAPKSYSSPKSRALTDDEQNALMQSASTAAEGGSITAKRDYAYMYWLLGSGQRMIEVLQLTLKDFSIRGSVVTWTTRVKGGDTRSQSLNDQALVDAIRAYLHATGRTTGNSPTPLWLSHDPKQMRSTTTRVENGKRIKTKRTPTAPLSVGGIVKSCKHWAHDVGIMDFHLHMLRHTNATNLSEQTGNMSQVQEQLGHQKLSTTQRYVHRYGTRTLVVPEKLKRK